MTVTPAIPTIPSQSGRIALVTGANTGIGKVTARELARAGAEVILACRSRDRAAAAIADIRTELPGSKLSSLTLDLGSLAAVRRAADEFLATGRPLDLLINNAGLAGARGLTEDGFELAFGVNYVGPYLLTRLLLPALEAAGPGARVVQVASMAHYRAKGIPREAVRRPTASFTGFAEYEVSKLGNVLFAAELARRLAARGSDIHVYSLHPGVVASDIWRRVPAPIRWIALRFMITVQEGARTSLYCATSPECAGQTGLYYHESRPKKPSRLARDEELAAELWRRTQEWVAAPDPPCSLPSSTPVSHSPRLQTAPGSKGPRAPGSRR